MRISPELLAAGGLAPGEQPPAAVGAFADTLAKGFLPVALDTPGLRVLNIDPPVLTIEGFLGGDVCDALVHAARDSGRMAASRVGGAASGSGAVPDEVRTSSSLAITKALLADVPALRAPLQQLLQLAQALVAAGGTGLDTSALGAMSFNPPAGPQQLTPELPQVAHYLPGEACCAGVCWAAARGSVCCIHCRPRIHVCMSCHVMSMQLLPREPRTARATTNRAAPGQHFLAHEDGFPAAAALAKGYQRRATLLV